MVEKMLRVHESFKTMLDKTIKEINSHADKDHQITMVELTKILAFNSSGSGVLAIKMPVVIIQDKNHRGRPNKPLLQRFININLEDYPR